MSTLHVDIRDQAGAKIGPRGWENVNRLAVVTGLTASNAASQRVKDAVDATGISIWDEHPTISGDNFKLRVVSIEPFDVQATTAKVRIGYQQFDTYNDPFGKTGFSYIKDWEMSLDSSLVQEEANTDSSGDVVQVSYVYPADYKLDTAWAGQTDEQGGTFPVMRPQMTLNFRGFVQDFSPGSAKAFLGRINSAAWNGFDAGKLLVTRIAAEPHGTVDAKYYEITVSVQSNDSKWQGRVVYIDPRSGQPPKNVTAQANAVKVVDVYDEIDFDLIFFNW